MSTLDRFLFPRWHQTVRVRKMERRRNQLTVMTRHLCSSSSRPRMFSEKRNEASVTDGIEISEPIVYLILFLATIISRSSVHGFIKGSKIVCSVINPLSFVRKR